MADLFGRHLGHPARWGGDSIALIATILITPMCLADERRWQWARPRRHMDRNGRLVAYLSFWALRLQIAYLYADSAIAKIGVTDWQNGSAFYYFVRDKMFGAAGPLAPIWMWLSDSSVTTLTITWGGAIVIELAIAVCMVLDARWRIIAFWLGLGLHALIFLSMGLFSFSLVMVAVGVTDRYAERDCAPTQSRSIDSPPPICRPPQREESPAMSIVQSSNTSSNKGLRFYAMVNCVLLIAMAASLWYLAGRADQHSIPPNTTVGFRSEHTLVSAAGWYAAQRAGVPLRGHRGVDHRGPRDRGGLSAPHLADVAVDRADGGLARARRRRCGRRRSRRCRRTERDPWR